MQGVKSKLNRAARMVDACSQWTYANQQGTIVKSE